MGLRTELAIDRDRCKDCGEVLAERGSTWTTKRRIRDGMIITVVEMLCPDRDWRCATITDVEYRGELLPSEQMQELLSAGVRLGTSLETLQDIHALPSRGYCAPDISAKPSTCSRCHRIRCAHFRSTLR